MPKSNLTIFVVNGQYPFPLDMLRYDCCWPNGPSDVNNIETSERVQRSVRLLTYKSCPTFGRWASFGWTVVEVDGEVR